MEYLSIELFLIAEIRHPQDTPIEYLSNELFFDYI